MKFYSTNSKDYIVDLPQAVMKSLPPDSGLYMPMNMPDLSSIVDSIQNYSFQEIATQVATPFLKENFSSEMIKDICNQGVNFAAPLVSLGDQLHVLELWHGPSLAFKDFGARFMAQVMSRLTKSDDQKLTILVATSGDTGGAVAAGFYGVDNVEVIILYPKGKVSPLQQKQLTTLGKNITALEIDGTFDDCQRLVKAAFLDEEVNASYNLSSANSINIARLIPQSFYYFEAYKQLIKSNTAQDIVFCVPSGNFGNLTAGLLAKRMGLPVSQFIAATNSNDIVPQYLESGNYNPRPSVQTISNAMDVGDPSNFRRMENLYGLVWEDMQTDITGYAYADDRTKDAIVEIKEKYNYTMDPHGAVGYLAAKEFLKTNPSAEIVILETAHPAKFLPVMEPILGEIDVPDRLAAVANSWEIQISMEKEYAGFREWMMGRII